MKRITKEVKAIADAHMQAKLTGKFNEVYFNSREDLLNKMKEGYTFSLVIDQIETRFVSVTSLICQRAFDHTTDAYKKAVYKGFKTLYEHTYLP
jgi:hypothetical protein